MTTVGSTTFAMCTAAVVMTGSVVASMMTTGVKDTPFWRGMLAHIRAVSSSNVISGRTITDRRPL